MLPEDYEDGPKQLDEGFEFYRRVTVDGSIVNVFQIFTEGDVCNELPDLRLGAPSGAIIHAATGGSCIDNDTPDARAGAGIFVPEENNMEIAIKVPSPMLQTIQAGEAMATKEFTAYRYL